MLVQRNLRQFRSSIRSSVCLTLTRHVQSATAAASAENSSTFAQEPPPPRPTTSASRLSRRGDGSPANIDYRNTLRLCSRIYSPDAPLRSSVWRKRLDTAREALEQEVKVPKRIAVVGSSVSGTADFLSCLLDEPMADASESVHGKEGIARDNQDTLKVLQARHERRKDLHESLRIRYGPQAGHTEQGKCFSIPHDWMRKSNVEFVELIDPTTKSSTLDELYASDMIIFITDDLTLVSHNRRPLETKLDTTLHMLRYFSHKPGTQVLVNHVTAHLFDNQEYKDGLRNAIGSQAITELRQQHNSTSLNLIDDTEPILHASFDLALRANDALRQAIAVPSATPGEAKEDTTAEWTRFSSLYSASGIGKVKALTEHIPLRSAFSGSKNGANLQSSTYLIIQSLDQALYGISAELDEVRQAQGAAQVLRDEVDKYEQKTKYDIFSLGREDDVSHNDEREGNRSASISLASQDSHGLVEKAFAKRLPWWRILWKVDDVRAETEAAVDRSFATDVERQMAFETGKMLNISEKLQQRMKTVFKLLNPTSPTAYRPLDSLERDQGTFRSAFHSSTLVNDLRRHTTDIVESSLKPDLLTRPIVQRREQLLAVGGPVDVLCVKAQKSVLTAVSITGGAGLISIVGALAGGPFGAGLPAIASLLAMQPSTAGGVFALASVFSVWLLQTRWTRAKKRFWRDWERISDGLDSDLRSNLDEVFTNVVGAQSIKGAAGLEMLAQRRLSELEAVYDNIAEVTAEIKRISARAPADSAYQ